MLILFYHETKDHGMVALSEEVVAGQHTPERHYHHDGHFLRADMPANAREHDTEELGKLGYRLATAEEQNRHAKQQKRAGTLEE